MAERQGNDEVAAALDRALARVGDRWSLLVVDALQEGPRRWTDLSGDVAGIAPNILAERLRRLEREGVVVSEPYSERPLRVAYRLTAEGRELAGAIRLLAHWGSGRGPGQAPAHRACGTALDARWYCPTCAQVVDEDPGPGPGDVVLV
jgi:DNA-binding HxlR family transcriptional regulator